MQELIRYLTENYPSDAMLFLPQFQRKITVKKQPEISKPQPELVIEKAIKPFPTLPPKVLETPPVSITLEKQQVNQIGALPKMGTLLAKVAPQLFIHKQPPKDDKAQKVKNLFLQKNHLPKIPVFYTKQLENHRLFLQNIAKAVDYVTGSCRLIDIEPIEKENQWKEIFATSPFSFIIAPDISIFGFFNLITHFKEIPTLGQKKLANIPVFLLPDLNLYLKDHNLKRSLWLELQKYVRDSHPR
jgi:hypothetical protein